VLATGFPIVTTQTIEIMSGKERAEKVKLPRKDFLKTNNIEILILKDSLE
jgi:hypothetical protein